MLITMNRATEILLALVINVRRPLKIKASDKMLNKVTSKLELEKRLCSIQSSTQ